MRLKIEGGENQFCLVASNMKEDCQVHKKDIKVDKIAVVLLSMCQKYILNLEKYYRKVREFG